MVWFVKHWHCSYFSDVGKIESNKNNVKKQQDIDKVENNKNNLKKQQETTNMKYILEVFGAKAEKVTTWIGTVYILGQ